ncbi:MAG: glycerophosphodiester phosphodiesterase [Desulforhopalus sp.]
MMNFFATFEDRQFISAHRGYRGIRPENSLCAFEASLGHCHFIELDIQMSRDGVAVIHHDPLIGRTSNGRILAKKLKKSTLRIDEWDLAELRQLDIGSWFLTADPFNAINEGLVNPEELNALMPQQIMTLTELLRWREKVQIPLNIELKDQRGRRHDRAIVNSVLDAIESAGCADMVLISSFRHDYLRRVKKRMPELPIGVLEKIRQPDNLLSYLADIGADAYHPKAQIIDDQTIQLLRSKGFGVNIFTVNDSATQQKLFAAGASTIFTDFPCLNG